MVRGFSHIYTSRLLQPTKFNHFSFTANHFSATPAADTRTANHVTYIQPRHSDFQSQTYFQPHDFYCYVTQWRPGRAWRRTRSSRPAGAPWRDRHFAAFILLIVAGKRSTDLGSMSGRVRAATCWIEGHRLAFYRLAAQAASLLHQGIVRWLRSRNSTLWPLATALLS